LPTWPTRWPAFVALAECGAAQEIGERIRAALQLPDNGAEDAAKVFDQIAADLDDATALLVLDNYEQLVEDGGVPVVETLLERRPRLRLLVTSRRSLRLPVECEIALAPLGLPDPAAPLHESALNPGVALFVERARDVRHDFQLGARNVAEVVEICRVLEGLPLAIELAAAKVRAWSLADMSRALATRRSEVLRRSTSVGAGQRHASLHAAIDWSWRLLTEAQQQFLMALTVFRGGWTAEAAEAVSLLPRPRELIESLVVDSLVQSRSDADGRLHFSMLETLREFARGQLVCAHATVLRRRHRAWFLALARAVSQRQDLVDDVTRANVLAAIASALAWTAEGADPAALADALFTHARVDWTLHRDLRIELPLQRAMQLAAEAGALPTLAFAGRLLAVLAIVAGDVPAADAHDAHDAQSVAHHLAANDRRGALVARQGRVRCLVAQG
jgi:predicted ATPase